MKKVTAVLIGAGDRGAYAYAPYALHYPHELAFVAVAEPNEQRRQAFAEAHGLSSEQTFESWQELLQSPSVADIAIICTQDRMHLEPTLGALEQGYHVLLEKPMSPDPRQCVEMELAAKKHNRLLSICHVLRYTPFWQTVKRIIREGKIGDIASVQLNENVGHLHMAHSFVRGNWNNSDVSSPMILAKSCHDMDILAYVLDKPCLRVSSFGSLMHFKEECAPEGAPERCLDGCPAEASCSYYAPRYYLGEGSGWARKITGDTSKEGILHALRTTPYGRCVYRSDNNVVDHQVVTMEFEGGATAMFSMCGFTHDNTRIVQIMGTKGEIRGNMEENQITVYDFVTKEQSVIRLHDSKVGHNGGDVGIIRDFLNQVRGETKGESLTSASVSVRSHLMAFAAEESRLKGGAPVDITLFHERLTEGLHSGKEE
ncbi:Gfo/Idh/MocA family oxidoreductase [Paenibacillus silviterrae]|uniref:Gfo/Idh/MocA family oxidoreductase n=1 Tax=Paenibacillus silviterrae TaxID=3242194 RepID=UPI002543E8DD|nr:Gfo/Idh/MocA family oxidoreductase [Paenibacillus chinjuensis]